MIERVREREREKKREKERKRGRERERGERERLCVYAREEGLRGGGNVTLVKDFSCSSHLFIHSSSIDLQ